jgi:hypothetical protein
MTVRDSITRTGARTPGAEDYPTSMAAHGRAPIPTQCGITAVVSTCAKGRHKPNISRCMPGAGLSRSMRGKVLPYMPAFQPYRGKPAVRNDREGRGNVGIIEARSAPRLYPTAGGARQLASLPQPCAVLHCTSPVMACAVKGGAFQWVQAPPGNRSSRKQPEQSWR